MKYHVLIWARIDRYTRAAQSSRNDLTKSNLQPGVEPPHTPKSLQATNPASPVVSMQTHPSAINIAEQSHFSTLPPGAISGPLGPTQQARLNQSTSAVDMANVHTQPTSPTSTKDSGNFDRPRRTSSMTINPSTTSLSQPTAFSAVGNQQQVWHGDGEALDLTRTTSSATLDGEPKIFPGVVSGDRSRRKSSMRSSAVEDGSYPGYRKGGVDAGNMVEEKDTDDEE